VFIGIWKTIVYSEIDAGMSFCVAVYGTTFNPGFGNC
jgi:hypothetical protein